MGSVYTFYDPEYSFLSLGQVTAVREIEYMLKIRKKYNEKMRYYFMGYYVHNCQKSVYKEHMHPQELLCPKTYTFVPLTPELKAKIVQNQFLKLNEEAEERILDQKKMINGITSYKVIIDRSSFLSIDNIRAEARENFIKNLISFFEIMGEALFDRFIFEYA